MPKVLPPHVRRQLKPMVCDLSEVADCSACRAVGARYEQRSRHQRTIRWGLLAALGRAAPGLGVRAYPPTGTLSPFA